MLILYSIGAVDDIQFGYKSVPSGTAEQIITEDEITLADGVKYGIYIRAPSGANDQTVFIGSNPGTTIGNTSTSGVPIDPAGGEFGEIYIPTQRPWDLYVIAIDADQHLKFYIC